MKFVIAGGHLTPAQAFAQTALAHQDSVSVIGSYSSTSIEAKEFASLNIDYHLISEVKYDRFHKLNSFFRSPLLIKAIAESYRHLKRLRPDRVVVFGSFTAIPVALAARLLHIPFYLHEQTRTVGLANRLICRFATGCAYSYPESAASLLCSNKLHTGNLIRPLLWHPSPKPPFSIPANKPILFVTGGNQGSKALVDICLRVSRQLAKKYQLIIQTGKVQAKSNQALIRPWFPAEHMAWLLHRSRIVICRGGANTIAEIMIAGTPAVIIPLPNSSGDEQSKNANLVYQSQAGVLLHQSRLNPDSLLNAINTIESAYPAYKQAAKKLKQLQNPHAAESLYQFVICHP